MYKTKLQEECQRRQWALPKYSAMKDGPDHNPRFKASVSVNGLFFHSPVLCKSSKDAHNDAAKLAFLHFSSSPPQLPPSPPPSDSSKPSAEPNAGGPKIGETDQGTVIDSHALGFTSDMRCQYKSQLQNYARWKKLDSPLYSSKSEGPPHALRFKARVTVDGHAFESLEFFNTLKEAEHSVAKAALMSLSLDGFPGDDSGYYKKLLQELAQREGFCIIYKTVKSGASHDPTFFSTVEVEGEIFYGKAGKSKKQAEIKAAMVAYTILKERGLSQMAASTTLSLVPDDTPKSTPDSDSTITVDSLQNFKLECELVSSPSIKYEEHGKESEDEVQEVDLAEIFSANAKISQGDSIPSPIIPYSNEMFGIADSSCSESAPSFPKEVISSSPMFMPDELSDLSVADSEMGKTSGARSYLLCNRVRVYLSFPDIAFPKGITVLPISDNKWVAVSLEFPNEEGY